MNPARRAAAGCLAVVLMAGLSACRHGHTGSAGSSDSSGSSGAPGAAGAATVPGVTPSGPAASGATPQGAADSGDGSVSQQDLTNLQGVLASVGAAASSARSAINGDTASPAG